jgi:hypothetical protein
MFIQQLERDIGQVADKALGTSIFFRIRLIRPGTDWYDGQLWPRP